LILHIPHSSRRIPGDLRELFVLSEGELASELLVMTDAFTDELFVCPGAARVVFPISRLIVDPERFVGDADEPMSRVGMGVVYTHTSAGGRLKRDLSRRERQSLIDAYYKPHHERLQRAVENELVSNGRALIVDCHSFPRQPLPFELDQTVPRPDFCVGTDGFHTPAWLTREITAIIRGRGFSVEENRPYGGAILPMEHYRKDGKVWSLMIEVCRDLYMERSGEKSESFSQMAGELARILFRFKDVASHRVKGVP
jgi:N-formylglutamate deformylase